MVKKMYKFAFLAVLALVVAGCGNSSSGSGDSESEKPQEQGDNGGNDEAAPDSDGAAADEAANPLVVIETSMGNITVELDGEKTPLTVQNFLGYVESDFYDSTIFHKVVPGYAILGGSFTSELGEKPTGSPIRNEADAGLKNARGTIAMARLPETIDSATSQFFINVVDNPTLDYTGRTPDAYGYCAFGTVVKGMDVVDKISKVQAEDTDQFQRKPVETVLIKQIRRVR